MSRPSRTGRSYWPRKAKRQGRAVTVNRIATRMARDLGRPATDAEVAEMLAVSIVHVRRHRDPAGGESA